MSYVDGFIIPLPAANIEAYRDYATRVGKIWREHGALSIRECLGDDVPPGELTSFPQSVALKEGETVVFSWVEYASREKRDEVMDKVMQDPRMQALMDAGAMPFDGKRMIYGGFRTLIAL